MSDLNLAVLSDFNELIIGFFHWVSLVADAGPESDSNLHYFGFMSAIFERSIYPRLRSKFQCLKAQVKIAQRRDLKSLYISLYTSLSDAYNALD